MAGETSLARQLKKLAVPQTTVLIQDKIRKSFLFDHRDASGLDREVVFAFGTCGLQKLCTLNPLFSKFENDLFSLNYKDFQRSVQSATVNEKLDAKISEFLRMLSPYFLIRDAHEALEWLIYRFHIHLYNVDDLIASVLPHYNTPTFVRVVQLLDLDEKSRWFWLKPVQTTGVHLEYSAVLNRFLTDRGFRKFVCDIAPNVLAVYLNHESTAVPVVSFSMCTMYNALERCKIIEDSLINPLFPYIFYGLKSDLVKYTSASYMILSKILSRVQLSSKIVKELLVKIFQTLKDDLVLEACEILLLAFQSQTIKSLPPKVFLHLLSDADTVSTFLGLLNDVKTPSLIKAFIKMSLSVLIKRKNVKVRKLFKQFLKCVILNKKCVMMCFTITATKVTKCLRGKKVKKSFQSFKAFSQYIFKMLEKKYPDHFDKAYKIFLEKKAHSSSLCNFINESICSLKYEVGPGMKTSLALGLYHANAEIRKTSVTYLLDIITTRECFDRKFVENSLADRLLDDNPGVVQKIFSSLDIVLQVLDKFEMLPAFEKILSRRVKLDSKWYEIQMKCLSIITKLYQDDGNEFDVIKLFLNFLFPINAHTHSGFLQLLNSHLRNDFIEKIRICYAPMNYSNDLTHKKFLKLNCIIVSCLKQFINEMNNETRVMYASSLNSKVDSLKSNSAFVFYIYVMLFIYETTKDISKRLLLVNAFLPILNSYFSQFNITEKFEILSEESVIKKCTKSLDDGIFPSSLILYAFYKLVVNPALAIHFNSWPDTSGGDSYKILSQIFNFCNLYLYSHKELLRDYFQTMLSLLVSNQFKNAEETFCFLSTKLLDSTESSVVQFNAINIAIALCKGQKQIIWFFEKPMIFFSVLKTIANPISALSHSALLLLSLCLDSLTNGTHPFKSLGEEVIKKSEEIKTDYRQCFTCIGSWLQPAIDYKDAKKSSRVSKELLNNRRISKSLDNIIEEFLSLLKTEAVPHSVKHFLLCCLQNIDAPTILSSCIPILFNYLNILQENSNKEDILNNVSLLIKKFTPKTATCFTEGSEESNALLYCLNFKKCDEKLRRCVQTLTLDVLNKDFFSAIASDKIKLQILENLFDLYITSPPAVNTKVEKVLRELCPYAYLFIKNNEEKLNPLKSTSLREAKKFKNSEKDTESNVNSWKKITVLLELMQNELNLLEKDIVISGLFCLLDKTKDYEKEENETSVEYIKQLILSAIHNCCEQLSLNSPEKINYDNFHVNKVIDCLEDSTNTKTHHQALLLLNLAATVFPDRILDKIMKVFVLMRTDLVHHDDNYSFQVLLQVIETILPSLLEASNQQTKTDGHEIVAHVIREFVNALCHIPGHRRLPLFAKIITTLDPSKYLWIPLGQICDIYADDFHGMQSDGDKSLKNSDAIKTWKASEFAISLHQQFSPDIQMDTSINLMKFLLRMPDNKKQLESNPGLSREIKKLFDVEVHKEHTDKHLQLYKQNILCYIKLWLSSETFLNQIAELSTKQQTSLEEKYKSFLESVLQLLQARLNIEKSIREDMKINDQVQLLYDIVHAINSFLPCNLFVQVVIQLLKNDEEIQLKAIELLNSKLEQEGEMFYAENYNLLLKLMKPLTELVNNNLEKEDVNEKDIIILQAAVYSLQLLCKLIGKEHVKKNFSEKKVRRRFKEVLEISIKILNHYEKPELIVNALLCVAQLCHCLNVDILRYLNRFMPIIINILQDKKLLSMNECLVLGILVALNSIVENLGSFLSSYMEDIVVNICLHSVGYSELGKRNIAENFVNLQTKLANEIPVRIFTNIILSCYSKLSHKNVNSVIPLLKILTQNLESSKYDDILGSAAELQNIYISLIDFRNSNQSVAIETVNVVESSIVSSLQTFVMKLSVNRFRTFFQKVYQWAVVSNDDQVQKFRVFTFYKITSEFSKSLKSLFSVMSKYFFTHVSSVLDLCNFSKSKIHYFDSDPKLSHQLLINMLDTLNYCFMYAEEQLLDKENFELLMQPLVDHLENVHDEVMYQDMIDHHLKSCIAHFMVAVSDSALWKSLNYQILLKTRHDSPKVRFGALQVISEVVNKMGENYLTLLPESIPFLAEIMEDESSEVEQECQTIIIEMEKTLGEPIRNYF